CSTGQRLSWGAIPFEGFLASRGRTYWRISIERITANDGEQAYGEIPYEIRRADATLLVTVEDVTELARSRLYVNAIDSISSAIVGPFALPQVLDRILQAVQEMVGSTRCAILLVDHSVSDIEFHYPGFEKEELAETHMSPDTPPTATI